MAASTFSTPLLRKLFYLLATFPYSLTLAHSVLLTMNPRSSVNTHSEVMFLLTSMMLRYSGMAASHVWNCWDWYRKVRIASPLQLWAFDAVGDQGIVYFPDASGCSHCHTFHCTLLLITLSHLVCSCIFEIAF